MDGDEHLIFDVAANHTKLERESRLYPDLIEEAGQLKWQTPVMRMIVTALGPPLASCLRFLSAMERDGFVEPAALAILGEVWREIPLLPDSDHTTLEAANRAFTERCLSARIVNNGQTAAFVVTELRFPLCGISLKVKS